MRSLFGILGLLAVLVVVALLAKQQLGALSHPVVTVPAGSGVVLPATTPNATPAQQTQQIELQVKQSVEAAMQQPRPMPDDK